MEFFELMDISHKYLEILNPSSHEKILTIGDILDLNADSRIIDFGCGKGEVADVVELGAQHDRQFVLTDDAT